MKRMKIITVILIIFPSIAFAVEEYNQDLDKVESKIVCTASQIQAVAVSNAEEEISKLKEDFEKDSIQISGWKKLESSIVFKGSFKHDRYIGMYCEDHIEILLSEDCEYIEINYIEHQSPNSE